MFATSGNNLMRVNPLFFCVAARSVTLITLASKGGDQKDSTTGKANGPDRNRSDRAEALTSRAGKTWSPASLSQSALQHGFDHSRAPGTGQWFWLAESARNGLESDMVHAGGRNRTGYVSAR